MTVRLAAAVAGAATTAIAASSSASTSSSAAAAAGMSPDPDRRRRRRRQRIIRGGAAFDDDAPNSCSDGDDEKPRREDTAPAPPTSSSVGDAIGGDNEDQDAVIRDSGCGVGRPSNGHAHGDGAPATTDIRPAVSEADTDTGTATQDSGNDEAACPPLNRLEDAVFKPPPDSWFENSDNNGGKEDEGGNACNDRGDQAVGDGEDECAAYDSSFDGGDNGGNESDEASSQNDEDSSRNDGNGDSSVDNHDTNAPASASEKGAATAITTVSTAAAAMQSIQYTGQAIASSASYAVTTALPLAAGELVTSSLRRVVHSAKLVYSNRTWVGQYRQHSDLASGVGGYYSAEVVWDIGSALLAGDDGNDGNVRENENCSDPHIQLPPFSSLPWIDRQLVKEWRTYDLSNLVGSAIDESKIEGTEQLEDNNIADHDDENGDTDDHDYVSARTLIPAPLTRPPRENAKSCHYCDRPFGPTLHRHHCRLCGRSCCHPHSDATHRLPHLGYDPNVAERVCSRCKSILEERNLAERIAWRLARLRDFLDGGLVPYFVTGVDTMEDAAVRLTRAAIAMARKIPLGAQATVAVETLEVLRKHGLKGVYGLILRKEFMAAADLLCQACGINRKVWPLSVHELSAAIFYALAHHRMVRGKDPEGEHRIHALSDGVKVGAISEEVILLEEDEATDASPSWSDIAGLPRGAGICGVSTLHEKGEVSDVNESRDRSAPINEADVSDPTDDGVHGPLASTSGDSHDTEERQTNLLDDTLPQRRVRPLVPVCEPASDSLIASLLFYAPLALNFIYATSDVDIQLLAAQQGWRLLYAHLDQSGGCHASSSSSSRATSTAETTSPMIEDTDKEKKLVADRPAFALLARPDQKLACLAIRGTATINDVVTDIRAVPVPFPPEDEAGGRGKSAIGDDDETDWTSVSTVQGIALCGMARAAINLYRENIDALVVLATKGYRIRIVGHSLGGGVSALLGALVRRHLKSTFKADVESNSIVLDDALRVYGYGVPACADAFLADDAASYVTSCVLHDDVVPRLTATSIRGLLKHLLFVRETWVKDHLSADISAYAERARGAWAPRWRQSFTLIKSKSKKQIGKAKNVYREYKESVTGSSASSNSAHDIDLRDNTFDGVEEGISEVHSGSSSKYGDGRDEQRESSAQTLSQSEALEIDGDLFYEAEEDMIESDEDQEQSVEDVPSLSALASEETSKVSIPEERDAANDDDNDDDAAPAVMLEETPLPRMFIPGKIVHIYTHRGVYKATQVPRKFRELRHISLAGNMLSDHLARDYYLALLEVKSVRRAKAPLPEWTGFGEESTCACCASRFTWASTSDTEAQEARDKHNCRMCGGLVCDPCSQNRLPLPELGISVSSRVCDRCYNDLGGVISDGLGEEEMSRSFLAGENSVGGGGLANRNEGDGGDIESSSHQEDKVASRSRQRRSVVVDELASRIPSVSLGT